MLNQIALPPRAFGLLLTRFAPLAIVLSVLTPSASAAPAGDGLFATFQIRRGAAPIGEFSCRLEFVKVPRTVASFVGLAEGSRPFIDFQAGHATRRPFYDGITIHRVEPGFVIQAGSPKGDGSDGPGYTFRDEFDPTLRHNKAGVLSMANNGLNSNGSQFFVTLAATPGLDDVHTVLGEVVAGMSVVNSIQQGDVIDRVILTRNGPDAQAFDADAHGLPVVEEAGPSLVKTTTGLALNYPQPPNTEFFVFHSDDLAGWTRLPGRELEGIDPLVAPRDVSAVSAGKARQFFNAARVRYPDAIHTPPTVTGNRLVLANVSGTGTFTLELSFTHGTSGGLVLTPSGTAPVNAQVTGYTWSQEAYRGRLFADIANLFFGNDPILLVNVSCTFSSATDGVCRGNFITLGGQQLPLAGMFTLSSPP